MKTRNRKLYSLALFRRIQGTTIRICPVESWFSTTRNRTQSGKQIRSTAKTNTA